MIDFREQRYVVLKINDLSTCPSITEDDLGKLEAISKKIDMWRTINNRHKLSCVVVENDWPEYETVWGMLKDRVDEVIDNG